MAEPVAKKSLMDRFLNTVEAAGNKLPDPATLFILLAVLVLVLSAVFGAMGASAVHPGTHKVIKVVNLLTVDGFRMIWSRRCPTSPDLLRWVWYSSASSAQV